MTGSLFSLPGTQYINVEHIHLVEERERQLPKDRRPRIQQGFAASLFLPLSLFSENFWLQMTFRGGGGAKKLFMWGGATAPRGAPFENFLFFCPPNFSKKHPFPRPLGDGAPCPRVS